MMGGQGACGGRVFTEGCGPQTGGYLDAVAQSWSENRVSYSAEFRCPHVAYPFANARWRRLHYSILRGFAKAVAVVLWGLIILRVV